MKVVPSILHESPLCLHINAFREQLKRVIANFQLAPINTVADMLQFTRRDSMGREDSVRSRCNISHRSM